MELTGYQNRPNTNVSAGYSYGSDRNGMIWGYYFTPSHPVQLVDAERVCQLVAVLDSMPQNEFLWLHFSLSNAASEPWLREHLMLPDSFFESLHSESRSTRLEQDDDALVAVLNDVLFTSAYDASQVETTSLFISSQIVISARLRPLRSVDRLKNAVRKGQVFISTAELLSHLLQTQAAVLSDILRQTTARVDQIEDGLLKNRISSNRSELSAQRRVLVRLQRLLAPEPASFFRLLNRPPDWIDEEAKQDLREAAEEVARAVHDTQGLIERIKIIQEELVALINEQANRSLFVLTVVTVLALPINLVAGLFGMNVGGLPVIDNKYGFSIVVGILLLVTVSLAFWAFGRRRE